DIPDLTASFLKAAQRDGEPAKAISPDALRLMQQYHWPGNVRELENLVRRLSALYADDTISGEIVQNELNLTDRATFSAKAGPVDVTTVIEAELAQLFREYEPNLPPP